MANGTATIAGHHNGPRQDEQTVAALMTAHGQSIPSLVTDKAQEEIRGTANATVSQPGLVRIRSHDTEDLRRVQQAVVEVHAQEARVVTMHHKYQLKLPQAARRQILEQLLA